MKNNLSGNNRVLVKRKLHPLCHLSLSNKCDDGGAFEAVSSIQIASHPGLSPSPFLKIQIVCFLNFEQHDKSFKS
jgi:hypothetical protein